MYLSIALCRLEKQVVLPASFLGQLASEWRRLGIGTERTVVQVPGEFLRQHWQVTSHKSHILGFQTFGVLPRPPPVFKTLPFKKKLILFFLTLIGRCLQSYSSFMSPVWSTSIYLQHVSLAFSFMLPVWSTSIYLQHVSLAFSFMLPVWSRSIYLQLVHLAFFLHGHLDNSFFVHRCDSFSILLWKRI